MIDWILSYIIVDSAPVFYTLLGLIILFGIYIFWRECILVKKNRSSVFDMLFASSVVTLLWGRVAYFLGNWDQFKELGWFFLPYERYGEEIFFFRLFPWRFIRFWDGGFSFIAMFLAFIVFAFVFVVFIKKWRWREMMYPIMITGIFVLSGSLFLRGVYAEIDQLAYDGFLIFTITVIFLIVNAGLRKVFKSQQNVLIRVSKWLHSGYIVLSIAFLVNMFLSSELNYFDKINVYGIAVMVGIMFIFYFLIDREPKDETEVEVKSGSRITINLNKPLRTPFERKKSR